MEIIFNHHKKALHSSLNTRFQWEKREKLPTFTGFGFRVNECSELEEIRVRVELKKNKINIQI